MLFAVVNLARKCKIDAESALQSGTDKFVTRFNRLEDEAESAGQTSWAMSILRKWMRFGSGLRMTKPE